jgi:hypothetical protein
VQARNPELPARCHLRPLFGSLACIASKTLQTPRVLSTPIRNPLPLPLQKPAPLARTDAPSALGFDYEGALCLRVAVSNTQCLGGTQASLSLRIPLVGSPARECGRHSTLASHNSVFCVCGRGGRRARALSARKMPPVCRSATQNLRYCLRGPAFVWLTLGMPSVGAAAATQQTSAGRVKQTAARVNGLSAQICSSD